MSITNGMIRRSILVLTCSLLVTGFGAATAQAAGAPWYSLFRAINRARVEHHVRPVVPSPRLHWAARRHSSNMLALDYFAHTSPDGSTLYDRIVDSGFLTDGEWWAGETLAWGTGTMGEPNSVVQMWLNSPEHRAILLSPLYRFVGIGRARGTFLGHPDADVWTADWGHR
jgi:uncharacterized protein YkwD